MNKPNPIDDLFKQQLGQSSADVPTDMWDRIAAERGTKRKPKAFWLWSSLGTLIVIAGFVFAQQYFSSGEQVDNSSSISDQQNEQVLLQQTKQQQASSQSQVDQAANKHNTNTTIATASTQTTANNQSSTSIKTSKNNYSNDTFESIAPLKGKTNETILSTLDTEIDTPIEQHTNTSTSDAQASTTEESRVSGPHQRQTNLIAVNNIPNLNFELSAMQEVHLFEKSKTSCARFNNPFFHLDLEMLLGPAYAQQQLSALASESNPHLGKRLDSESSGVSYSAGVRLAATSNVGLGLRTGLIYSQINDIYKYEVGSRMQIDVILNANEEIIRRDTTYLEAYTENHQNHLKFIEVPLLVGYETRMGKFRVGINAGAYLNLLFDAKGQISSPLSEEPIDFGQVGESNVLPIFNKRASAAWYAGASIAYNLHSRYSLIAEPYFKTFPRALSAPDYDLTQNYWTVGMQLGLRVRL